MFGSNKKFDNGDKIDTLIGKSAIVEGTINGEGTIRIDGKVNGGINITGNLVLGEEGLILGNIKAENAFIAGTIEGNVTVNAQLHLTHTARLTGDMLVKNVVIDEGAVFNGSCKILSGNE